jgi:hypothetical protein
VTVLTGTRCAGASRILNKLISQREHTMHRSDDAQGKAWWLSFFPRQRRKSQSHTHTNTRTQSHTHKLPRQKGWWWSFVLSLFFFVVGFFCFWILSP